jgi:hypothetical protein
MVLGPFFLLAFWCFPMETKFPAGRFSSGSKWKKAHAQARSSEKSENKAEGVS